MRHKYAITRDHTKQEITLQEFTDVDKDAFSLVCEVTYKNSIIESAAALGAEELVNSLRTTNFFPCGQFAEQIAQSVLNLYGPGGDTYAEVLCNDLKPREDEKDAAEANTAEIEDTDTDEEADDIDDLLADDFDHQIKSSGIDKPISVDISETGDIDDGG